MNGFIKLKDKKQTAEIKLRIMRKLQQQPHRKVQLLIQSQRPSPNTSQAGVIQSNVPSPNISQNTIKFANSQSNSRVVSPAVTIKSRSPDMGIYRKRENQYRRTSKPSKRNILRRVVSEDALEKANAIRPIHSKGGLLRERRSHFRIVEEKKLIDRNEQKLLEKKLLEEQQQEEERQKIISLINSIFEQRSSPETNTNYYEVTQIIGKGAFGKVIRAKHKLTGKSVAIKLVDKAKLAQKASRKARILQEIRILKQIRHPNIVKIFEVFESSKYLHIVLEYWGGGDLNKFVMQKARLTETETKIIFKQILYGARACHGNEVLHRDFKLDNILLSKDLTEVKICDFGVSKIIQEGEVMKEVSGTPMYIAPEIILGCGYKGFTVDIWSLGVMLFVMLVGTVPFQARKLRELNQLILRGKFAIPKNISALASDLLRKMICLKPIHRPSLKEILDHPWFTVQQQDPVRKPAFVGRQYDSIHRHGFLNDAIVINQDIVEKVSEFGYPKSYITSSLNNGDLNHATTTYFLLEET